MATRYSVANGNWNATSTWSASSGGSSGASVPATGDRAIIEGGFTVTLTGDTTTGGCDIDGGGSAGTLVGGGYTLTCDGDGSGTTFDHDGNISGHLDVVLNGAADNTSRNLDLGGGGTQIRNLTCNNANTTWTLINNAVSLTGNLTITAGTLNTGSDIALTVAGDVDIATAGTLTTNASAVTVGAISATGNGTYNATTHANGTIINSRHSSLGRGLSMGSVDRLVHNNGKIVFQGASAIQLILINGTATSSVGLYDVEINSTAAADCKLTGAIDIYRNLTITAGELDTNSSDNYALTVDGDVSIASGGELTGNASAISLGSLTIESGGTYSATSGTTTITDQAGSGYAFRELGTFTHNNGTMKFTDTGSHPYVQGSSFYNLEVALAASTLEFRWEDSGGSLVTIDNDLTITRGRFKFNTAGDSITVHGLTKLESDGQFGLGSPSGTHAFNGLVTLNGGTWYLSSGTNNMAGIRNVGGTIS